MDATNSRALLQTAVFALVTLVPLASLAAPRLIPFQGRLADATGRTVADGPVVVQFQIFEAPSSSSPLWAGEVHRVTVNAGLVNVTLGSKNPLPSDHPTDPTRSFFDTTLYLQVTPDANGDGKVTEADAPLLPRQAIVPVVFAAEAARAREADRLQGFGVSTLPTAVPVGGVLMWWGSRAAIPPGFELCDGSVPSTPGATLATAKPDLRDRFPKGAMEATTDVASSPVNGGTHTVEQRTSMGTALTEAQMPIHIHRVDLTTNADGTHRHKITTGEGDGNPRDLAADGEKGDRYSTAYTNTDGAHSHRVVGNTGVAGAGQPHSHRIPEHDNRPAFLEMFFIIRVK